jgi:putative SOS response-associated peptidase YedK
MLMIPHSWEHEHMCGRYASTKTAADIADEFQAIDATGHAAPGPDHNVAPTKPVLAVVERHPRSAEAAVMEGRTQRTVRVMRWGLVPSWAKDPSAGARMINARSETAERKPTFRAALAARRCLLPADGWFEWRRDGSKQAYFVTHSAARWSNRSLAMAGVWEFWRPPGGGEALVTAAVLTTAAVGSLADIHERMPLLVAPTDWAAWLNPDSGAPRRLLRPPSASLVADLELRPVSSKVNDVAHNGPDLVAAVEPAGSILALDLSDVAATSVAGAGRAGPGARG